jgi:dihydropteroate synthase
MSRRDAHVFASPCVGEAPKPLAADAMALPKILFVTGKLAEPSLRRTLQGAASEGAFTWSIAVLPISVAALATCEWIGRHLRPATEFDRVILPGLCAGTIESLANDWNLRVERGPKDLRDLPDFLGSSAPTTDYGIWDIEIIAEINHAPRLPHAELLASALELRAAGADVIDLGCDPGPTWSGIGDAVRALREANLRVSVDTFNPVEASAAVTAGAELVLSVNSTNVAAAAGWGCEVVVVPDDPGTMAGLDATIERLTAHGTAFRVDPVIEPLGFGFARSLGRYLDVRRRYPRTPMLMGIGNLTELTDVDSAGINVLLMGFCQELGIRSVLTTQVINWCRSSVRELDLARRLVHFAVNRHVLPKRLEPNLIVLRDAKTHEYGEATLAELAARIADRHFRLFAERGRLHILNGNAHLQGDDPYELFRQMHALEPISAAHAFYLGYEMAKAVTALTLGKDYVQDQALNWGHLTRAEQRHTQQRQDA